MSLDQTLMEVEPIFRDGAFVMPSFQESLTALQIVEELKSGELSCDDILSIVTERKSYTLTYGAYKKGILIFKDNYKRIFLFLSQLMPDASPLFCLLIQEFQRIGAELEKGVLDYDDVVNHNSAYTLFTDGIYFIAEVVPHANVDEQTKDGTVHLLGSLFDLQCDKPLLHRKKNEYIINLLDEIGGKRIIPPLRKMCGCLGVDVWSTGNFYDSTGFNPTHDLEEWYAADRERIEAIIKKHEPKKC